MKYHIRNKATHWDGDRLVLVWCVVNRNGKLVCDWTSRARVDSIMGRFLAQQRRCE